MITPHQIRSRLDEVPFKPFLLTMSDGTQYPISNRDVAGVGLNEVIVGTDIDEQSFPVTTQVGTPRRGVRGAIRCAAGRGADSAARCPYLNSHLFPSDVRCAIPQICCMDTL